MHVKTEKFIDSSQYFWKCNILIIHHVHCTMSILIYIWGFKYEGGGGFLYISMLASRGSLLLKIFFYVILYSIKFWQCDLDLSPLPGQWDSFKFGQDCLEFTSSGPRPLSAAPPLLRCPAPFQYTAPPLYHAPTSHVLNLQIIIWARNPGRG